MPSDTASKLVVDILAILIDIFNLAEQIGVYFIAKENDLDEKNQQLFFFILFAVGGASLFKPLFIHPIPIVLFSIAIEVGELVAYLKLLPNTTSLLVVSILFFCLEVILHMLSLFGRLCQDTNYCDDFAKGLCTIPARVIIYGLIFETQILFLFLDPSSSLRGTFYEILMLLSTFFGLALVEKTANHCCGITEEEPSVYGIWEAFVALLNAIEGPILLITAVVYASQALQNRDGLKTYDFVIYIIILISYGSVLLVFAISLLCTLICCFGALVKAIFSCFKS